MEIFPCLLLQQHPSIRSHRSQLHFTAAAVILLQLPQKLRFFVQIASTSTAALFPLHSKKLCLLCPSCFSTTAVLLPPEAQFPCPNCLNWCYLLCFRRSSISLPNLLSLPQQCYPFRSRRSSVLRPTFSLDSWKASSKQARCHRSVIYSIPERAPLLHPNLLHCPVSHSNLLHCCRSVISSAPTGAQFSVHIAHWIVKKQVEK